MRKLILSTAALALMSGAALAQETVRLGTEGAYPPYNYLDDNGEVAGYERELGDAICAQAELTCEWVTNDWDSIIPNLVSGNYDVIIAGMSITDERDEVIDFTEAYFPADPSAFISTSDAFDGTGEADAVLADKAFLEPIVAESGGELVFAGEDVILGDGIGIGVRESDGELKDKLNAAIAALKADGTVNTLIEKWFEGMEGPY